MHHFRQARGARADHHHHGLRRFGHGGRGRPQRGLRVPAETVRPDGGPAGDRACDASSLSPPPRGSGGCPALPQDGEDPIVGHSAAIQEVFKRIALVAPSDACVHLRGESGTGKELAARAIHRYSRRSGRAVRGGERGLAEPVAGRKRAVRPRPRGVHRRRSAAQGSAGAGPRRHDLPGRSGRHPACRCK